MTTLAYLKPRRCGGACRWLIAAVIITVFAGLPIAALLVIATGGSSATWNHLFTNALPSALPDTILLLAGVAAVSMIIGTAAAWLVASHDFPGRRILDWALLLPLAVPTYVIAFAYLDILHPIGPFQSVLRAILGIANPQDLRLPDIRSVPGAILLLGIVLYPYVYLSTRAMFVMQSGGLVEAARTLGASRSRVFARVSLPLARPAIAVGTSLALMETLNDVGAAEFLGIQTLTLSVYSTWINRSDLPGAAGLALFMLLIVLALVFLERLARRQRKFAGIVHRNRPPARRRVTGLRGWLVLTAGSIPVLLGFIFPALYLVDATWRRVRFAGISSDIVTEALNSLTLSAVATVLAIVLGLTLVYAARVDRGSLGAALVRASSLGYALPGTVLAIGLLIPVATLDNAISDLVHGVSGVSVGLIILSSGAVLVYGYVARFLAISAGGIESGFERVPVSLDGSARTLGRTAAGTLISVHLPLVRPAIGAAAILVFVECMKELPLTLLLRPLNVETLSTHVFAEAARGTYEDGAIAALAIVAVGILPIVLLSRLSRPTFDPA